MKSLFVEPEDGGFKIRDTYKTMVKHTKTMGLRELFDGKTCTPVKPWCGIEIVPPILG